MPSPPPRPFATLALKLLGALVGLALSAWTVSRLGPGELARALAPAAAALPVCLACELAKIGCETLATRHALGSAGARVPLGRLYVIHVVTYGVGQVFPLPRPAAEATKAALLYPLGVPPASAAASGAALQAATFVSVGGLSLVCAVFVRPSAEVPLRALLVGNGAGLIALGVGLRALVRSTRLMGWLGRRWPRLAGPLERFRGESARGPLLAPLQSALLGVGMLFNVLALGAIARVVGASPRVSAAFAAFGAQLVAATAAVFVPGQLGAREAAFSLSADALGTTPVLAGSISITAHAVQLGLSGVSFVLLLALRVGGRGGRGGPSA
ncbi:MAG: flippase-like domain-containing protein [Myxococcales bacterium]|nr:flippase-like domain-containing protein [Myxococcales bacterium]MBL0197881.1 flippase-like domain-containing protein [Myxococcales bacterium]